MEFSQYSGSVIHFRHRELIAGISSCTWVPETLTGVDRMPHKVSQIASSTSLWTVICLVKLHSSS